VSPRSSKLIVGKGGKVKGDVKGMKKKKTKTGKAEKINE